MNMFDAPSTGAKITDFEGRLLLVYGTEAREAIQTSFGPADAIVADVVALDGPSAPQRETGVLLFQKKLQGQVRGSITSGRPVLGRLGKGVAKANQSAPWELKAANAAEQQIALDYLAKHAVTTSLGAEEIKEEIPF